MSSLTFCVVIVNYNGHDDTVRCVDAVLSAAKASRAAVDVLVVDNSSESFSFASARVRVRRTGHNIGLSGAWYVGLYSDVAQSSDYLIFLNNDAFLGNGFFDTLQRGVETWGADCAFGPRICYASNPGLIWSRGGRIQRYMVKIRHFGENVSADRVKRGDFETGHLSGCCMIIRTAHLNRVGGPDTNFFFRGEEWDLNYRLSQSGVRLVILDHAEVYHEINGSHSRFAPNMLYLAYRAKVLFAKKILPRWYFPIWYLVAFAYAAFVAPSRFARASKGATTEIRGALVRAFVDGLKSDKIMPIA